jgi:hypothetical protein
VTQPTSGSAKLRTSFRSASGSYIAFASEKTTISPRRAAARRALSPAVLPRRSGLPRRAHAARRVLADDLVGAVVGGVGDDDDLEPVGG